MTTTSAATNLNPVNASRVFGLLDGVEFKTDSCLDSGRLSHVKTFALATNLCPILRRVFQLRMAWWRDVWVASSLW